MTIDNPGDGLTAPVIDARDDDDPLSPASLSRRELDVRQAIHARDNLKDISPDPCNDPAYKHIRAKLVEHESELRAMGPLIVQLVRFRQLIMADIAALDQTILANILAHRDAMESYEIALAAHGRLGRLWEELDKILNPKRYADCDN